MLIRADNAFALWRDAVRTCLTEGARVRDGEQRLLELHGVAFRIAHPEADDPPIRAHCRAEMIEQMRLNFLSLEPQFGYKFAYGERLGLGQARSAVDWVVGRLAENRDTKSATISLLRPADLESGGHVPCITTLDFKVRDGVLCTHYFARSQDLFKKSYADNLAIFEIGSQVARRLEVGTGFLAGYLASGHIYAPDQPAIEAIPLFAGLSDGRWASDDA